MSTYQSVVESENGAKSQKKTHTKVKTHQKTSKNFDDVLQKYNSNCN